MVRKLSIRTRLKKFRKRLASRKERRAWLATLYRLMVPHVTYIGITGSCPKTPPSRLFGTLLERAGRCRTKEDNGISHVSQNVLLVSFLTRFCVQEIAGINRERYGLRRKFYARKLGW